MLESLLGLLLAASILAVSAWVTQLFAGRMYRRCPKCRTLNARRRNACRECAQPFGD